MSNRTERDQGFGPLELRRGVGGFPGWRGLQRTGDTVLEPGRFYRNWNSQITDGAVECRGGQLLFADMGTAETRNQCITSIFCTNNEWPDVGQAAEIRFADIIPMSSSAELDPATFGAYRGDSGQLEDGTALSGQGTPRRHRWLRDGADNTSSGAETPITVSSSVRLRERVYVAQLDGAIKYLEPGVATYTTLAAAGVQFAAGLRLLCMVHQGKLVVTGIDTLKTYDPDSGSWATISMPALTTGFIPAGWTRFDVDDCLYIFGTVDPDAKLIKFDGTTATVSYTAPSAGGGAPTNIALDCASNNGRIVVTYYRSTGVTHTLRGDYSDDGITFTASTAPTDTGPSRMCVADGMIWSLGVFDESEVSVAILMYSYDGSEWLEVLDITGFAPDDGVLVTADIVQIAPVDNSVADTTAEPS